MVSLFSFVHYLTLIDWKSFVLLKKAKRTLTHATFLILNRPGIFVILFFIWCNSYQPTINDWIELLRRNITNMELLNFLDVCADVYTYLVKIIML